MAYSPKGVMDIYQILARWHAGYSIKRISRSLQVDRKTVRRYIRAATNKGLSRDEPLPEREVLLGLIEPLLPKNDRATPARSQFEPYREEIIDLVTRSTDPLKAKTAYQVICHRYRVKASYSSFKRYFRTLPTGSSPRTTSRVEVAPGAEIQIDYAKVGRLLDPETGRERTVYAFIGTLSHSRYKFVEFAHKQDQRSFAASHVRMFEFFGGASTCIVIDNLKSGVVKPDRYDPTLNPLYRDLAEHYGTFIDTARVRKPRDKGKVERAVQSARELFRKLKTLHDSLILPQANQKALNWCRKENGLQVHGTTGEKPAEAFAAREQAALIPLPDTPFELATWKQVKVHPDQYIQFEKKAYSVPLRFVGHKLWARGTDRWLQLYDEHHLLVKQHVRTPYYRHTDWTDFPKSAAMMLSEEAVQQVIRSAGAIGPAMETYLTRILEPHAKINLRKAQGLIALRKTHDDHELERVAEEALALRLYKYKEFRHLLEQAPELKDDIIEVSEQTLTRSPDYFIH